MLLAEGKQQRERRREESEGRLEGFSLLPSQAVGSSGQWAKWYPPRLELGTTTRLATPRLSSTRLSGTRPLRPPPDVAYFAYD